MFSRTVPPNSHVSCSTMPIRERSYGDSIINGRINERPVSCCHGHFPKQALPKGVQSGGV